MEISGSATQSIPMWVIYIISDSKMGHIIMNEIRHMKPFLHRFFFIITKIKIRDVLCSSSYSIVLFKADPLRKLRSGQ
jgi:hypothetical protein